MDPDSLSKYLLERAALEISGENHWNYLRYRPRVYTFTDYLDCAYRACEMLPALKRALGDGTLDGFEELMRFQVSYRSCSSGLMETLRSSDRPKAIVEMLTLLAFGVTMQEFEVLYRDEQEQLDVMLDAEAVGRTVALLCYYVCLNNPHVSPGNFNELYARCIFRYFDDCSCRLEEMSFDMENWRQWMEGCLFYKNSD